jgi:hypothetical protein
LGESLLRNHLSINDDSLGTERIVSAPDKADANLAQYGAGSNNKDGGTGTCAMPSADSEADAMESSVLGEKGDDHAEKFENKDNINWAGKGGVVDKGGNVVNDTNEMTKINKIQQEALTKIKILHFINAEEYAGASEVYKKAYKENNGLPPISYAEEVAAYVQNYIQDDAEINIYFPNLPISEGRDGDHSSENDQQFSHVDIGASEARFNAEYVCVLASSYKGGYCKVHNTNC